jgi:ankyrin repeat protein
MASSGDKSLLHIASEHGCAANLKVIVEILHDLHCEERLDCKCMVRRPISKADIVCSLRPLLNAQNGMTPLHYAAKGHDLACVKLLVVAGANVNALNVVCPRTSVFKSNSYYSS